MNIDDYIKLFNDLLDRFNNMELKRFYLVIALIAFGLCLFASPEIIRALQGR